MTQILPVAPDRRTARVLGRQLIRLRGLGLAALTAAVAAGAATVIAPLLLGRVVDTVIAQGPPSALAWLVAGLVATAVAAGILAALANRLSTQLGYTMAAELRERAVDSALALDAATLEAAGSGDVASRVTEDVEVVNTSVSTAAGVFISLVTIVITMTGFATLDWRLLIVFVCVFPVHLVALRIFLPEAARRYAVERKVAAARTQAVLTAVRGAPTVHAYGLEARQTATVERASDEANQASLNALWAFLKFSVFMNGAEAVGLAAAVVSGFFLVRAGQVSVGDVTAAAVLFHRLFGPLGTLLFSFNEVQRAAAALGRLIGVADLPVPPAPPPEEIPAAAGVRAYGLGHAYRPGHPVLYDVSVGVPAGRTLAIVGESGAGKTTLAAILGGVFPPSTGEVAVGGAALADLDPARLRRRVGVVTQEVHTFAGTLADDLLLARPDADAAALAAAVRRIGADAWVDALPDGLATRVGPGDHELTAAQSQQLALARIALANPPVVILDEATAEAGSAGARELERSARALISGRTAIVVAHRLSQASECDEIMVLAQGRIVEQGGHAELVAAGGRYAELWAAWHR